jgi:hypothetical protein
VFLDTYAERLCADDLEGVDHIWVLGIQLLAAGHSDVHPAMVRRVLRAILATPVAQ